MQAFQLEVIRMSVSTTQIDRVARYIWKGGAGLEFFFDLVLEAAKFFEDCPEDFCLQNAQGGDLVFGGTNRLLWSINRGFRPDRSYCTERFLKRADVLLLSV